MYVSEHTGLSVIKEGSATFVRGPLGIDAPTYQDIKQRLAEDPTRLGFADYAHELSYGAIGIIKKISTDDDTGPFAVVELRGPWHIAERIIGNHERGVFILEFNVVTGTVQLKISFRYMTREMLTRAAAEAETPAQKKYWLAEIAEETISTPRCRGCWYIQAGESFSCHDCGLL